MRYPTALTAAGFLSGALTGAAGFLAGLIVAATIASCGPADAAYNYANLHRYPMDDNGVVCYYYSDIPASLSCVKVTP